jgi:uncharacterized protein
MSKNTHRLKKIVLAIDGGGVRGCVVARFLENLERALYERNGEGKLHETFDLFVGTSTGALIVSGIAHKRLPANFISNYIYTEKVCGRIFNKTWRERIFGLIQKRPMYNGVGKRQIIKEILSDTRQFNDTAKHVMVTCYDITTNEHILFKSWNPSGMIKLIDALDVSSAAPGYFPSVEYKPDRYGIDGGIFANNPTETAYIEALQLFGKDNDIRILSIGTGKGKKCSIGKDSTHYGGINWATQGELVDLLMCAPIESCDYRMKRWSSLMDHKYIRINGNIDDTALDDCSQENIDKLRKLGDELWYKYQDEVLDLILR